MNRADLAGGVLVLLALPAAWIDLRAFLAGWLCAWWFCIGLMLGALANLWMHRLSGGRWGEALRPAGLLAARRMPLALALFLPVAAGLPLLYAWAADPSGGWARELARPAFVRWWLQPSCFGVRAVLYAAAWLWLSRPAVLATRGRTAVAMIVYALTGSLAAVDLLMSLVPGWTSTAFGLVVLSGQALGGAALMTLWTALARPQVLIQRAGPRAPPVARDLGNLLLTWVMGWAYLAFMEFLIIWAENLPHEIRWFLPRLSGGWAALGVVLAAGQFALPLLALLQRRWKDRPAVLAAIAAGLLATQLLNTAWLVLPSIVPHSALGWWVVPLLALGFGLLLFGTLPASLARHAQVLEVGHVVE